MVHSRRSGYIISEEIGGVTSADAGVGSFAQGAPIRDGPRWF
jgi:hypothetical protein